jgi:hypothetical protein
MSAWIGIIFGVAVAYYGFKRGFFEMWGKFFNLIISVYLAIFLRPVIIEFIPDAGNSWGGIVLTILIIGVGIFFILYGISYIAFGQFTIELPKIFDIAGGAFMGFLGGILIWSSLIFLFSITPLHQSTLAKNIGLAKYSAEEKSSYLCWWGDFVNLFAGSSENVHSTEEVMIEIFNSFDVVSGKGKAPIAVKPIVSEPNEAPVEKLRPIEEELGPPPELDFDII